MAQNFNELAKASKSCPVTGLPITQKPEWTDVTFGGKKNNSRTILLIGEDIVLSAPCGYTNLHIIKRFIPFLESIVKEVFPDGRKYILIEDFSKAEGASIRARTRYIDYLRNNKSLKGLIFHGASPFFKVMIKSGKRLNPVDFQVEIVDDYESAMILAQGIQSSYENANTDKSRGLFRGI